LIRAEPDETGLRPMFWTMNFTGTVFDPAAASSCPA
jgi:hypothetical protein